jgi:chromosome partitioning protein
MTRITTVALWKGGSGKTATVKNLAAALAWSGRRVLVVDLDPQADASKGLGVLPDQVPNTLWHLLENGDIPVKDAIYENAFGLERYPNMVPIHILPSEKRMTDKIRGFNARQTGIIKDILSEVQDSYDNILIDTPPSDSLITVNAFIASNDVILPVQAEQEALDGLDSIIESIAQIKRGLNPGLQIAGILPVMVKRVSSNSMDMVRQIDEKYPDLVVEDWIPETALFGESTRAHCPLVFIQPLSEAAQKYVKVAGRLM